MTILHLVRHGAHDWLSRGIAGRMAGVHLNNEGKHQAERLAEWFAHRGSPVVYASPLERARETAAPIAARLGKEVSIEDGLHELDFGEWQGKTFQDLDAIPDWKQFNEFRIGTRPTGGELMVEVQARMVAACLACAARHNGGEVVLVGHGDPIKCALTYFAGMHLELFGRIEVSPGSISTVELVDCQSRLAALNLRP